MKVKKDTMPDGDSNDFNDEDYDGHWRFED